MTEIKAGVMTLDGAIDFEKLAGIKKFMHLLFDDGTVKTAVRHTLAACTAASGIGHRVEGPMMHGGYEFTGRHKPFAHQRITADFLTTNLRAFVLNGMGTGKTSSALWALDYLRNEGQVRRVLVLCPLSTMECVWADETFTTCPHLGVTVLHGTSEKRLRLVDDGAEIMILNHDGLKIPRLLKKLIDDDTIDLIIVDEFTAFKDHKTERFKALKKLVGGRRLWMMSGSPAVQAPTDVWAPCRLVNPDGTPSSAVMFRDSVMYQASRFKWKPKPGWISTVNKVMQPAVRFRKEDCIDLPQRMPPILRKAEISPEQHALLEALRKKWLAEGDGFQITAANQAVRVSKVFQVLQGAVITTGGDILRVPSSPREEVMLELLNESQSKSLVFATYTAVIDKLSEAISKDFSCAVIDGRVPLSQRSSIISAFQQGSLDIIIAHPRTLSHGVTLTAASTTVWYGPTGSNETYTQANDRMDRPGQKHKMTVGHIFATATEREWYEKSLAGGVDNETVLSTYDNFMRGKL